MYSKKRICELQKGTTVDQYKVYYQDRVSTLRKYLFDGAYYSVYCLHREQAVLMEADNFRLDLQLTYLSLV